VTIDVEVQNLVDRGAGSYLQDSKTLSSSQALNGKHTNCINKGDVQDSEKEIKQSLLGKWCQVEGVNTSVISDV